MDDRIVLSCAFRDAIRSPQRVGNYQLKFHRLRSGKIAQIHEFRFGYANFVVLETEDAILIEDLWLDPELSLAAE